MIRVIKVLVSAVLISVVCRAHAGVDTLAVGSADDLVLQRVFGYAGRQARDTVNSSTYVYTRYNINTVRRNFTLMFVPSMYAVAHGRREHAGETYMRIDVNDNRITRTLRHLNVGTVPHGETTLEPVLQYLTPTVYEETIGGGRLLSPFYETNRRYYRYTVTQLTEGRAEIMFRPRIYNTRLVAGVAVVDMAEGRLLSIDCDGEYDMIRLRAHITMNEDAGLLSLYPRTVDVEAGFKFVGNKIKSRFFTVYDIGKPMSDTIVNSGDRAAMDTIRPCPLPATETAVYARYDSLKAAADTAHIDIDTENRWKKILWDVVGDNLLNRIHGSFGKDDRGYLKLTPIFNPLYMNYSSKRGLVYKFRIRARWDFSKQSNIALFFKGGYSFKLNEFYYRAPLRFTFDNRRHGYIELEYANGNRITTSDVADKIKSTKIDSIVWSRLNLDYFNHQYSKLTVNYDLNERWTVQPGMVYHHYTAIDKKSFAAVGQSTEYKTFAPMMEVQYRPYGWHGAAFTINYERGLKGVGHSATNYERVEIDASWLHRITSVRSLSLRVGTGFYTDRSKDDYFLFYDNFREDNLSDGWDDDWSGNFQILDRHWYNSSKYYVRANTTYESPLMIMSHLPLVGKIVETERIYMSTMAVEHLHPYTEFGYGFTNRVFSMGVFWATRNGKFDGMGARIGLELFRDW